MADTMSAVFAVSRVFGVFPFAKKGLSKFWGLYSVVIHVLYAYSIWVPIAGKLSQRLDLYGATVVCFLSALDGPCAAQTMKFFVDRTCFSRVSFAQGKRRRREFALLIPLISWSVVPFIAYRHVDYTSFAMTFASHLVVLQYCVIIHINTRDVAALRSWIHRRPDRLSVCCQRLQEVSHRTQCAHNTYALAILLSVVMFSVSCGFLGYVSLLDPVYRKMWYINMAFILEYSYSLILVVGHCNEFRVQFDAFYEELFRVMWKRSDLCRNNKLLLYIRIRPKVNFTACGFFTLGYPLVTSIVAAVTVYLSVLVQFHKS